MKNPFLKPVDYLGYDGCILFPNCPGKLLKLETLYELNRYSFRVSFRRSGASNDIIIGVSEYYWRFDIVMDHYFTQE